jgi:hypothetical protein
MHVTSEPSFLYSSPWFIPEDRFIVFHELYKVMDIFEIPDKDSWDFRVLVICAVAIILLIAFFAIGSVQPHTLSAMVSGASGR